MGTTITIDSSQSEKNKGGASGGSKPQSIYLQLIPAQVEHVILIFSWSVYKLFPVFRGGTSGRCLGVFWGDLGVVLLSFPPTIF